MNLPKMLSGQELTTALQMLPEYHQGLRQENAAVRLMALSDLYSDIKTTLQTYVHNTDKMGEESVAIFEKFAERKTC